MLHLDLFSGIGGFAYAVDQVWDNAEHIFCDNDKFCRQVLKKHWSNSKIYEDIRTIITNTDGTGSGTSASETNKDGKTVSEERELTQFKLSGQADLLTAGVPCQPASQAGRRGGKNDNRWLWPQTFAVIRITKPNWVILENVRGLLSLEQGVVFEELCVELENCGYEIRTFIIPAVAVNAPHRRDRVWFVAHSKGGQSGEQTKQKGREDIGGGGSKSNNDTDTNSNRLQKQGIKQQAGGGRQLDKDDTNTTGKFKKRSKQSGSGSGKPETQDRNRSWDENWIEVATELCRVDDGLPAELDYAGWTKAGHRVQRLKSLGNAIVPQVAVEIMKSIKLTTPQVKEGKI